MASFETHERVAQIACEALQRSERIREAVAKVFGCTETAAAKRITHARQAGFHIPYDHTGRHQRSSYTWAMFAADLRSSERIFDAMEWRDQAACRDLDTSLFFPEHGTSHHKIDQARAVCQSCPVIDDCLNYALDNHERFGIWGGLSERQRRRQRNVVKTNTRHYLTGTIR